MSDSIEFRFAETLDAPFLAEVYNAAMVGGRVTAETRPVTAENRVAWLQAHPRESRPCWLALWEGEPAGMLYLSDFHPRPAYSITAEISLYLQPSSQQKGLGKKMLAFAQDQALNLGVETLVGLIYDINEPSLRLFAQAGFERVGYLPRVARHKEGERGLVLMAKRLTI